MAHDPHHDSIIENLKEIFARCSELEDRLEFLENELEAHADYSTHATGGWREMANILDGYCVEFGCGKVRVPNVVRVQAGKVWQPKKTKSNDIEHIPDATKPYYLQHPREHCVAYQEGGLGCPDCYDYICDACGEHKEGKPSRINTETLAGVVMCKSCSAPKSCDSSCTDDSCPVCGGNTPERIEEQIEWLKKLVEDKKEIKKMTFNRKNIPHKTIWMLKLYSYSEEGKEKGKFYWTFTTKELAIDWAVDWVKNNTFEIDVEAKIEEHGKEAVVWNWTDFTNERQRFDLDCLELYGD